MLRPLFPDHTVLLALSPEELAKEIFPVVKGSLQHGKFHYANLLNGHLDSYMKDFPASPRPQLEVALAEALQWLSLNALVMPAPGDVHGWHVITRRGMEMQSGEDFDAFRRASAFPKSLLHPTIAEHVWLDLARGDLSTAVFRAFKAVEEAVRVAGGFAATEVGVVLMRKAFNSGAGPLTDLTVPEAEREALANLFVGGIGSYKNPHSHRTVTISDATEAQEMVMLASHLLRIVDARKS